MKNSRRDKIEAQLAATESELHALLSVALPQTAVDGDMLFFNSRFRPGNVQPHWLGERGEALVSLAAEAVELRELLGIPLGGSPGHLYISACEEAIDTANGNRRGPRQLASALIAELRSNNSFKVTPDGAPQLNR